MGGPAVLEAEVPAPSMDDEFEAAVHAATTWARGQPRFPSRGRVLWSARQTDGSPVSVELGGASAGGTFGLGLAFLLGLTPATHRRPQHPQAVLTARIDGYGLLGAVDLINEKADVVPQVPGGRLVVAGPAYKRALAAQHDGQPEVSSVVSMPEAARAAVLPRSLRVPVAVPPAAAVTATGGWTYRQVQDSRDAAVQRRVEYFATQTRASLGSAPDSAAASAPQAHLLDPKSPTATAVMLAAAYDDIRLSAVLASGKQVNAVDCSADGRFLAVAAGRGVTVYTSRGHRMWGQARARHGTVTQVRFTADGGGLVLGTDKGEVLRGEPSHTGTLDMQALESSGKQVLALATGPVDGWPGQPPVDSFDSDGPQDGSKQSCVCARSAVAGHRVSEAVSASSAKRSSTRLRRSL